MPPPSLLLLSLLVLLLRPSCTNSELTVTSEGWITPPTLASGAHVVQAFKSLGPNLDIYESSPPHNSMDQQAPLQLLDLKHDKSICSELLSGTVTSRTFANVTVFVQEEDLRRLCAFSLFFENPTSLFLALEGAGASAIVISTEWDAPGVFSNMSPPTCEYDLSNEQYNPPPVACRAARASRSTMPFVAIGRREGDILERRLRSHPSVPIHVAFNFDPNRYQIIYSNWLHILYKLFVGGICSLAIYKGNMVGITPVLSTKGLVVMCEVPSVVCLLWFTIRGPLLYDALSPTLVLACGDGVIFVGLASKVLVARFWSAYNAHLKLKTQWTIQQTYLSDSSPSPAPVFVDPVRASPLTSLAFVAVAILWQVSTGGVRVYYASSNFDDPESFESAMAAPFVVTYFFITIYFFRAATGVLLSLADKRTRVMSAYLLASASFMIVHMSSIACLVAGVHSKTETSHGLVFFFWYLGRAGTAMCCISIFHEHADSAFLFLEMQNARLAEDVRRLEETAGLNAKLTAAEIARLMEMQRADAVKVALVHQEALVKREKDFIASALHELRNPLSGIVQILQYVFSALKTELTSRVSFELEAIEACTDHMQLFLKNVLSLDKILDGSMPLPRETFGLANLCKGVKDMVRHSALPGVTIETEYEESAMLLRGAAMQLNLMLLNLVSNAAKFTTEGRIVLSATVLEETAAGAKIKFSVTDTGPGIPADKQRSIFEMRSQTGGLVSQSKGFGIGLNVASKLAVLMGAELCLKSPVERGMGSEFSVTLMLGKAETVAEVEKAADILAPPQGLRVLIVDDGKLNQKLLSRRFTKGVFKDLRWSVEVAVNGEQALEMMEGGSEFDLIVMDENMQETGGVLLGTETTKLIREREEEKGKGKRAVIVGHSGNCTDEDKERGKKSGQDWFWEKPPPTEEKSLQDVAWLWGARVEKKEGTERDVVRVMVKPRNTSNE